MTATPAIDGWFTTGDEPALLGSRCTTCGDVSSSRRREGVLPQPGLRRRGVRGRRALAPRARCGPTPTRSTSRRAPYVPRTEPATCRSRSPRSSCPRASSSSARSPHGYGVGDLRVGAEVELVVETLYTDETGDRTIWRWKPVTELGEEADQ